MPGKEARMNMTVLITCFLQVYKFNYMFNYMFNYKILLYVTFHTAFELFKQRNGVITLTYES